MPSNNNQTWLPPDEYRRKMQAERDRAGAATRKEASVNVENALAEMGELFHEDGDGNVTINNTKLFYRTFCPEADDAADVVYVIGVIQRSRLIPRVNCHVLTRWNKQLGKTVPYIVIDYREFVARGKAAGVVLLHQVKTYYDDPADEGRRGKHPFKATAKIWGPNNPPPFSPGNPGPDSNPFEYQVYWDYVIGGGSNPILDADPDLRLRKICLARAGREFAPHLFTGLYLEEELDSRIGQAIRGEATEQQSAAVEKNPLVSPQSQPRAVENKPGEPVPQQQQQPEKVEAKPEPPKEKRTLTLEADDEL